MNYQALQQSKLKARKQHDCLWCSEKILSKEIYYYEVGVYDGHFQHNRWHPECLQAFYKSFKETGEDLIYPHESKRGGTEHC